MENENNKKQSLIVASFIMLVLLYITTFILSAIGFAFLMNIYFNWKMIVGGVVWITGSFILSTIGFMILAKFDAQQYPSSF